MIRLLITPSGEEPRLHCFEGARVTIGSRDDNDLVLRGEGVSRLHLWIESDGERLFVRDGGSRNGTYVDRLRVEASVALRGGEVVEIPGHTLTIVADDGPRAEAESAREPPPPELLRRAQRWTESGDPIHLLGRGALLEATAWRRHVQAAPVKIDGLLGASEAALRRARWRRYRPLVAVVASLCAGILGARVVLAGGATAFADRLIVAALSRVEQVGEGLEGGQCERAASAAASAAAESSSADETLLRALGALECAAERDHGVAFAIIEPTIRAALGESFGPVLDRGSAEVVAVAADPNGCRFAWGTADGRLHRLDRCGGGRPRVDDLGAAVRDLAYAGGMGLAVTRGGELFRWEPGKAGAPVQLERGEVSRPGAVAIAGDGRLIAAAASDAPRLDVITVGHESRSHQLAAPASHVAIADDASILVAIGGAVAVVGGQRRGRVRELITHTAAVSSLRAVVCERGGRRESWVLSGSVDGQVLAMPRKSRRGRPIELQGLRGRVDDVALTPECRHVVAASGRALRMWDLDARDPSATGQVLDHDRPVFAIATAADGALITASGRALRRWDLEALTEDPMTLRHGHGVVDFALVGGGREALVAFEDRSVRLWDLAASLGGAGAEHLHHQEVLIGAAIDAEGERIVTASAAEARLWRAGEDGIELLRSLSGHLSPIRAVDIAADGRWAATVSGDGKVLLWPLNDDGEASPRPYSVRVRAPRDLAFAGRHLVVAGDRGACVITPSDDDERRCRELSVSGELDSLYAEAAVARIAYAGHERFVTVLDLDVLARAGVADRRFSTDVPMSTVTLSRDGQWLAVASDRGDVRIAKIDGDEELRALQGAGGRVVALALSADGRWLAAADERTVLVYRVREETAPARTLSVDATVTGLVFAGDDLLVTTTDGALRRWSVEGEDESVLLGRQRGVVRWLAVAATGELALTAGDASAAHLWPLSPRRLLAQARRVIGPSP